jgi:hypothetical protein
VSSEINQSGPAAALPLCSAVRLRLTESDQSTFNRGYAARCAVVAFAHRILVYFIPLGLRRKSL